jgi:hypothetical protein
VLTLEPWRLCVSFVWRVHCTMSPGYIQCVPSTIRLLYDASLGWWWFFLGMMVPQDDSYLRQCIPSGTDVCSGKNDFFFTASLLFRDISYVFSVMFMLCCTIRIRNCLNFKFCLSWKKGTVSQNSQGRNVLRTS